MHAKGSRMGEEEAGEPVGCPVCFGEPGPERLSSVSYPEVGHSLVGTQIGLKRTSPMGKLRDGVVFPATFSGFATACPQKGQDLT